MSEAGLNGADEGSAATTDAADAGVESTVVPTDAGVAGVEEPVRPHAFLFYNLGRLALLLLAFGIFYLVGFRGVALVVVALLVSGAVSYLALYRLRGAAAVSFADGWKRWNAKLDARASAEDVD